MTAVFEKSYKNTRTRKEKVIPIGMAFSLERGKSRFINDWIYAIIYLKVRWQ